MAEISLTNSTIYAQNINNFTGELFKVGGQRTPLLSAVGGLNGGKVLNSTFWQVQVEDNAKISTEPTKGQEGSTPTEFLGRDRAAYTYVTQIFHKGVQMTYTALASTQNQNPFDLSATLQTPLMETEQQLLVINWLYLVVAQWQMNLLSKWKKQWKK